MKRGAPLRSRKPLRRLTRLRARSQTNSYRRRDRDVPYMLWVKRRPCIVRELPPVHVVAIAGFLDSERIETPCTGRVEADHMGARGMGQKADDDTCVPMCSSHHQQRHAHNGAFKHLTRDEVRAWRTRAIEITQAAWRQHAQPI